MRKSNGVCVWKWAETERNSRIIEEKPGPDQVRFIESVTTVTNRERKLPLSVKQARVTPLSLVELSPFVKRKTQSFPHFRVNKPRVFTKPALWNGPQLSNTTCPPINTLNNIYPCPVSEGPKESHLGDVWPEQPCHSYVTTRYQAIGAMLQYVVQCSWRTYVWSFIL